jgi:hypothetical protein
MAENFNQEISEPRLGLILEALKPYDDEAIGRGIKKILWHSRFFPTVAELLNAIEGNRSDQLSLEAESQWTALREAMMKHGSGVSLKPYVSKTAWLVLRQMGGQRSMAEWRWADMHWHKKEWLRLYRLLSGNESRLEAMIENRGALPLGTRALIEGGE